MIKRLFYILIFLLIASQGFAADIFVSDSLGNDTTGDGSYSTPYKTIAKVNSLSLATGDDVYFLCGDTWTGEQLWVDWEGSAEDRAVIGAYYGAGTIGVSGNKPIIDGNHTSPSAFSEGLIHVYLQDYVTVTNLDIRNSEGWGIRFHGITANGSDYGEVTNVDIDNVENGGIIFYWHCDNGLVENCTIHNAGEYSRVNGGDWPATINASHSDSLTVRYCTLTDNHGEGIGFFGNQGTADDCIAEYNIIGTSHSAGIYPEAAKRAIVRYNMIYGTTDSEYFRCSGSGNHCGNGISVADENITEDRVEDIQIYGNLIANRCWGIYIGVRTFTFDSILVYNNTIVGCYGMIATSNSLGGDWSNSAIKNNLFWQAGGSYLYSGPSTTSGLTWDYNNWSESISGDQSGTNDVIGTPNLYKTEGWQSLTEGSLSATDFALQSNSPCINAGEDLGDTYDDLLEVEDTTFPLTFTFGDQDDQGAAWEIGGDIYITEGATVTGTVVSGGVTESEIVAGGETIIVTLVDNAWVSNDATVRVNCGGTEYTDGSSNVWSADTNYNTGNTGSTSDAIAGTTDDELYQAYRWDPEAAPDLDYAFTVENGNYTVNLHFADIYHSSAGQRIFDVYVEGVLEVDDLDIISEVGTDTAHTENISTTVSDGELNITLDRGSAGNPMISAIEILTDGAPTLFESERQNIIDGLDAGTSQTYGWNNEVRDNESTSAVVRTNDTTVTITLSASAAYNPFTDETITVTIPGTAVTGGSQITASPTFAVTAENDPAAALSGTFLPTSTEAEIVSGGKTIIITLTNDTWGPTVGDDNAITTAIINGIDSNCSEIYGWDAVVKAGLDYTDVSRDSSTQVTVTLNAEATYDISANETITVTIPASALVTSSQELVAAPVGGVYAFFDSVTEKCVGITLQ